MWCYAILWDRSILEASHCWLNATCCPDAWPCSKNCKITGEGFELGPPLCLPLLLRRETCLAGPSLPSRQPLHRPKASILVDAAPSGATCVGVGSMGALRRHQRGRHPVGLATRAAALMSAALPGPKRFPCPPGFALMSPHRPPVPPAVTVAQRPSGFPLHVTSSPPARPLFALAAASCSLWLHHPCFCPDAPLSAGGCWERHQARAIIPSARSVPHQSLHFSGVIATAGERAAHHL
jgi:hypothetical protein